MRENPAAVKTGLDAAPSAGYSHQHRRLRHRLFVASYLRQLPVDTLKVDRSFVLGMRTHDESAAIIGTVTRMARQLGLHVVAEGIEREEQVPLLALFHCESGQGYLFARPLDVDVATEILKTGVTPPRGVETVLDAVDSASSHPARTAAGGFAVPRDDGWRRCGGGGDSGGDGRRCAPIRSGLAIARETGGTSASSSGAPLPPRLHLHLSLRLLCVCILETAHYERAVIKTSRGHHPGDRRERRFDSPGDTASGESHRTSSSSSRRSQEQVSCGFSTCTVLGVVRGCSAYLAKV